MITNSTQMAAKVTLRDLLNDKLDIFCWCHNCGHNKVIETIKVINKLGPNYPIPEIGCNLRCRKCNKTDSISTRPNWPDHKGQLTRHMM